MVLIVYEETSVRWFLIDTCCKMAGFLLLPFLLTNGSLLLVAINNNGLRCWKKIVIKISGNPTLNFLNKEILVPCIFSRLKVSFGETKEDVLKYLFCFS